MNISHILVCPPMGRKNQAAVGLRSVTPDRHSKKARCSRCSCKVWIGPRQQEARSIERWPVCCWGCAKHFSEPFGGRITHLGGHGHS
jgi:hypothetical protein